MQEYEKYQELLNQKHKMEEQFQRKGNGFILGDRFLPSRDQNFWSLFLL